VNFYKKQTSMLTSVMFSLIVFLLVFEVSEEDNFFVKDKGFEFVFEIKAFQPEFPFFSF
jgi:hypothetical protein